MNHWETTESVTNEAETIHFGANVCGIASPRPAGLPSPRGREQVPEGDMARGRGLRWQFSSRAQGRGGRRERGEGAVSAAGFY